MANLFTKVSSTAFNAIQHDAGMILNTFNPADPKEPEDSAIVCATTGGISVSVVPQATDFGEDVDNVPNNTLELKRIDSYECKISFTALDVTEDVIKMALGAVDVSGDKITPRHELKTEDFKEIWWVGDTNSGCAAVCLKNALSTGGLSLTTSKGEKGQIEVELTGHYSISDVDAVPVEFYVIDID